MPKATTKKQIKGMSKAESRKQLIGLEGWLALFIVGQFFGIAITLFQFFYVGFFSSSEISTLNEFQTGLGDSLQLLATFENMAIVTYIAITITTLVLLFRRHYLAKQFAIATLLFGAIYCMLDYYLASTVFSSSDLAQNEDIAATLRRASSDAGRAFLAAIIWIPYFLVSKRVARTLRVAPNSKRSKHEPEARGKLSLYISVAILAFIIAFISIGIGVIAIGAGLSSGTLQEPKPKTFRTEYTGSNDISYSDNYICGGNADFYACINMHVSVYNSTCVSQSLSSSAHDTCDRLLEFINQLKSTYSTCGYDCKTVADAEGKWGWQYLQLVPETRQVSDYDT